MAGADAPCPGGRVPIGVAGLVGVIAPFGSTAWIAASVFGWGLVIVIALLSRGGNSHVLFAKPAE